jgi:hypothetical protein
VVCGLALRRKAEGGAAFQKNHLLPRRGGGAGVPACVRHAFPPSYSAAHMHQADKLAPAPSYSYSAAHKLQAYKLAPAPVPRAPGRGGGSSREGGARALAPVAPKAKDPRRMPLSLTTTSQLYLDRRVVGAEWTKGLRPQVRVNRFVAVVVAPCPPRCHSQPDAVPLIGSRWF